VRFTSRSSRDAFTGPAVFAALLLTVVALSAVGLMRRVAIAPAAKPPAGIGEAADDAPHYTGSIVIPAPGTTTCRHLLFDNVTGQIREVDSRECVALAPNVNSTEGRIGAIRRSFSRKPDE
jgi:hypothetical protein